MSVTFAGQRYIITEDDDEIEEKINITDIILINESGAPVSGSAPVVLLDQDDKLVTKFLTLADDGVDHRSYGGSGSWTTGLKVTMPAGCTIIICVN